MFQSKNTELRVPESTTSVTIVIPYQEITNVGVLPIFLEETLLSRRDNLHPTVNLNTINGLCIMP